MPKSPYSFLSFQLSSWVFFVLIIALGSLYLFNIRPGHDWGDDFAAYILHAQNLVAGRPYADIGFILNPFRWIAPAAYPPVFPFLLSVVIRFFGTNLLLMKVLVILFWEGSLCLLFFFLRNKLQPFLLFLLLLAVGLHPFLFYFLNNILSEIPFMFFTLLCLYVAEQLVQNGPLEKGKALSFVVLGVLIYFACGTRSIGMVLVPSLIVYDIAKHKRLQKETLIAILACFFLVALQSLFISGTSVYFQYLDLRPFSVFENLASYISRVLFGKADLLRQIFFIAQICFVGAGFYSCIRKKASMIEPYVFFYVCAILVFSWPYPLSTFDVLRYFVPILPFYFYYMFVGAREIFALFSQKLSEGLPVALAVVIIFSNVATVLAWGSASLAEKTDVSKKESIELFEYVKKNTSKEDVFIFAKPRALSLFTGRSASAYYPHANMKDFWDYLLRIKTRYIIVWKGQDVYLRDFVKERPKSFSKVFENSDFQVFKLLIFQ